MAPLNKAASAGDSLVRQENTAEGWSRHVTVEIADELRRRYVEYDEVAASVLDFLEANRR